MNTTTQEPLTKTRVLAILNEQAKKYTSLKASMNSRDEQPDGSEAPEIDALIETRHAYQLLADQARMFAALVGRME
jgi:hypothetical protein